MKAPVGYDEDLGEREVTEGGLPKVTEEKKKESFISYLRRTFSVEGQRVKYKF